MVTPKALPHDTPCAALQTSNEQSQRVPGKHWGWGWGGVRSGRQALPNKQRNFQAYSDTVEALKRGTVAAGRHLRSVYPFGGGPLLALEHGAPPVQRPWRRTCPSGFMLKNRSALPLRGFTAGANKQTGDSEGVWVGSKEHPGAGSKLGARCLRAFTAGAKKETGAGRGVWVGTGNGMPFWVKALSSGQRRDALPYALYCTVLSCPVL